MDEAGDMLTLSPGLGDIAEDEEATKISEDLKRKEWERSKKWGKMAKVAKKGKETVHIMLNNLLPFLSGFMMFPYGTLQQLAMLASCWCWGQQR